MDKSISQVAEHTLQKMRLIFLFIVLTLLAGVNNGIAETAPELKARLISSRTVLVTIKSKAKLSKSNRLLVAKAVGESGKFKSYLSFSARGTRILQFSDELGDSVSQIKYKTRLAGRTKSKWSRAVKVVVDGTADNDSPDVQPAPGDTPDFSDTPPPVKLPAGASVCPKTEILKVIELVNDLRSLNGLVRLVEHDSLALSSILFSARMAENGSLSHEGWFENILNAGYAGVSAGQNIGYTGQLSASLIVDLWINSPGHKVNMLTSSFSYTGVGCVIDANGLIWWTQDFGG